MFGRRLVVSVEEAASEAISGIRIAIGAQPLQGCAFSSAKNFGHIQMAVDH
jgi:hypothetical protein